MILRDMTIEDVKQVGKLHNELAYYIQSETEETYFDFDILDEYGITEHLKEFIDIPSRKVIVATEDGTIVGFIAGEIVSCYLPISSVKKVGYISGAYVKPEYRGQGIMKTLEKRLSEYFQKNNMTYIEVNFISKNEIAKRTWEGLGYTTFREQARRKI